MARGLVPHAAGTAAVAAAGLSIDMLSPSCADAVWSLPLHSLSSPFRGKPRRSSDSLPRTPTPAFSCTLLQLPSSPSAPAPQATALLAKGRLAGQKFRKEKVSLVRVSGFWREGGTLDKADKRVSGPIFRLDFPKPLELLLSVPGAFMGFPHAFFGPTPLALAWLASPPGHGLRLAVAALVLLAGGVLGFYGGLRGMFDFTKVTKLVIIVMPSLSLLLLSGFVGSVAEVSAQVGRMSLSLAALAVAASVPLKALSDRQRPAAALGLGKELGRRAPVLVPYIQGMCTGGQSREALPSSDAAVMAANAVLLWRCWQNPPFAKMPMLLAITCFSLACFGRMYMWAHHLLDVTAGGLLGAAIALGLLHAGFGTCNGHVLAAFALFVVAVLGMQKRTRIFDNKVKGLSEASHAPSMPSERDGD